MSFPSQILFLEISNFWNILTSRITSAVVCRIKKKNFQTKYNVKIWLTLHAIISKSVFLCPLCYNKLSYIVEERKKRSGKRKTIRKGTERHESWCKIVLTARVCDSLVFSSLLHLMTDWNCSHVGWTRLDNEKGPGNSRDFVRYFQPPHRTGDLSFVSASCYLLNLMHSSFTLFRTVDITE